MKRDSKLSELIKALVTAIVIIAIVKLFWSIVSFFLPIEGIDAEPVSEGGKLYYRYRLATDNIQKSSPKRVSKSIPSIRRLKLLAVYKDANETIAVVGKSSKSYVLLKGDTIDGFRLEDVTQNSAEFIKGSKRYILKLKDIKLSKDSYQSIKKSPNIKKYTKVTQKVDKTPSVVTIQRENIDKYIKNMDKIWKDINIVDVKKDGKLIGFRVRYIRRGSFFEKIGLKRGDLIVEINGEQIVDYSLPMKKLKEINTLDGLTLTVKRDGEIKELEYEIE